VFGLQDQEDTDDFPTAIVCLAGGRVACGRPGSASAGAGTRRNFNGECLWQNRRCHRRRDAGRHRHNYE
jgi:hypothetical protein